MFRIYFAIGLRNMLRHKLYSSINILGLAIGMAAVILILLFIRFELSMDQHHPQKDRIYRVLLQRKMKGDQTSVLSRVSGPVGPAMRETFPEVENTARIMTRWDIFVTHGEKGFYQGVSIIDPELFEIFSLPFVIGEPGKALKDPYTVVLTERTAKLYFGDENPIGKIVTLDHWYFRSRPYTVTGVIQDQKKTHLDLSILTATVPEGEPRTFWESWFGTYSIRFVQTYVLLAEGADPRELERKLPDLMEKHLGKEIRQQSDYLLQPLNRIHLYSQTDHGMWGWGDITYIYFYSLIALFILAIACVNFMNLATARSGRRAREVGLRKAVGGNRSQLIVQFLSESLLFAFISVLLAIALAGLTAGTFGEFVGRELSLNEGLDATALTWLAIVVATAGIFAGSYPAFYLSGFQPASVLKGDQDGGEGNPQLRKVLVIFQFAVSIVMIIGTTVSYQQIAFMQSKNPGFDRNNLVTMPLFQTDRVMRNRDQGEQILAWSYDRVKDAFLQHPNILKTSAFRNPLGNGQEITRTVQPEGKLTDWRMPMNEVDEDFLDLYELELISGRNFSAEIQSDRTSAYILNQTAAKQLGWKDPIGKTFGFEGRVGQVIGVVKDFHHRPMQSGIGPVAFCMRQTLYGYIGVRIREEDTPETLAFLKTTWERFLPNRPFEYTFENERDFYRGETRAGNLVGCCSGLAIFVACLGLIGLASFTAERRTREIGIRKVLGASIGDIVILLSKDFIKFVLIANLVAWPIAYYTLDRWLQEFAYRMDMSVWPFALGTGMALSIALATVGFQAWKVARTNPIDALRYE